MAKVALLIGVSEYEPGLSPLPAAVRDVDAMREVLLHSEMGGFVESDIVLLKNPRRQEMEESIETLFSNRHRDDLILLFFSGHGIKDDSGRLFLGTSQTRKTSQGDLVRSSAVAANFVHENMGRSRSKRQVVILDSCFSGAFAEGLSAKDDGSVDIRTQLGGEGRAVLTSSSSTQYSFEQEGEELSLYTRFLIHGIETGAADLDGDDVVSIDELHEYASRKVREVKPEMRPEICAVREGFKIRLSRVPQGDPQEKYKKEVARCGKRGELTIVSRSILDTWRVKLGLSVDAAKALEDEVLEPYRRDFQQKLQQYEQTIVEVLQRDGLINERTRQELRQLQQVLELRNEDTVPIEARIIADFKTRNQSLEAYKQSFSEALRQEYPLGGVSRFRLQEIRQGLELSDTDVAAIEAQVTTEVERYRRNLQDYEQAFITATQQDYPLSESKKAELRQLQSSLGLSDVEIAPVEAKATTQVETYQQKLEQYRETFTRSTQRKYVHGEANRSQLTQTWRTLGLNEADVKAIEEPILAQVKTHQSHLRQYEQAFVDATEQEHPLSQAKRSELRQRQRSLSLSDEDIEPIENRVTAVIEDHLKKLQQYEQVFSDSIQFEFPVSEDTREELRRFQQILELANEEVAQLEAKIASQAEQRQNESQQSNTSPSAMPSPEVNTQEAKSLNALERYEIEVAKYINAGVSPKDYVAHKNLNVLRNALKLSLRETEAIKSRLTRATEPQQIPQSSNTTSNSTQGYRSSTSGNFQFIEETGQPEDDSVALARQNFLGWVTLVSLGVVMAGGTVITQFLGSQPLQPSPSSTPSPSMTAEVLPIAESKASQCNAIKTVTDKLGTEISSSSKKLANADQKTKLDIFSQLATKINNYAEELQAIKLKDEKLKDFQRNYIKIYIDSGKAMRDMASAGEKNDDSAMKTAAKNLELAYQPETQLVDDFNKYCQGK